MGRRRWLLLVVACLTWLGCERAETVGSPWDRETVYDLIGKQYTETRLSASVDSLAHRGFDLKDPDEAASVRFISMTPVPVDEGLRLDPVNNDPILYFGDRNMPYNRVSVEMQSSRDGALEVFWRRGDEEFSAEKRSRVEVHAEPELTWYVVDLPFEPQLDGIPYSVRIDPIDDQVPVVIRQVLFERVEFLPPGAATPLAPEGGPVVGKAKVGELLRSAVVLNAGEQIRQQLTVAPDLYLSFGLAAAEESRSDAQFEVLFRPADGTGDVVLFSQLLGEQNQGYWNNYRVSLDPVKGFTGVLEIRVSLPRGDKNRSAAALLANPRIGRWHSRARQPNVILVSLDTLGSKYLPFYEQPARKAVTPTLSALAEKSAVFEDVTTASSLTHASHASILTGKVPLYGNVFWMNNTRQDDVTLADRLRQNGYSTAAFTGGVMVTANMGFDRGFETFYQADSLFRPNLEQTDVLDVFGRAREWLAATGEEPFFLFLHTYEVHSPLYFNDDKWKNAQLAHHRLTSNYMSLVHMRGSRPVPLATAGDYVHVLDRWGNMEPVGETALSADDLALLRQAYREEIERVDGELGVFLEEARQRGHLDDTIIVVTADHGEAFFEHDLFEHGLLYEENLRVPLLVYAPGLTATGRRIGAAVSTIDITPTILDLVGMEQPGDLDGTSLRPLVLGKRQTPRDTYTFVPGNGFAWKDPAGMKLIWRIALLQQNYGQHELFDLATDPGEQHDLGARPWKVPDSLSRQVRQTLRDVPAIFVGFSQLAGKEYDLELSGRQVTRDRVYAVEIDSPGGFHEKGAGWEGRVRFGEQPFVFFLGLSRRQAVTLVLRDPKGEEEPRRYVFDPTRVNEARTRLAPLDDPTGKPLLAWRVGSPISTEDALSEAELDRLRSLGYIQ